MHTVVRCACILTLLEATELAHERRLPTTAKACGRFLSPLCHWTLLYRRNTPRHRRRRRRRAANTNDHAIRPGINFVVSGTEGDSSFGQLSKGAMYKRFDTNTRAAARATRSCPRLPHVAGRGWSDQRALSLERPFSRNAAAFSMCAAANAACARARGQSSAETAS